MEDFKCNELIMERWQTHLRVGYTSTFVRKGEDYISTMLYIEKIKIFKS